jgi:hypothetical protein
MKRPRGVTIIACLLLAQGVAQGALVSVFIAAFIVTLVQPPPSWLISVFANMSLGNWAGIVASAIVAILALASGVALLLLRSWAWMVAMLLQGYSLAISLWSLYRGYHPYVEMLLPIIIVFYLNTREVRRVFESLRHPASARNLATLGPQDGSDVYGGTSMTRDGASAKPAPEGTSAEQRPA